MSAVQVACPKCGAPAGERCVELGLHPYGWRKDAQQVVFAHSERAAAASPRFVTQQGERLHRLAQHDLDGAMRARCGLVVPAGFLVPVGDALRSRLHDCGSCARAGLVS